MCSRAKEGSVLIVSVNAHPGSEFEKDGSGEERSRLDRLKELVGEGKNSYRHFQQKSLSLEDRRSLS